jgi:hypothetical protein
VRNVTTVLLAAVAAGALAPACGDDGSSPTSGLDQESRPNTVPSPDQDPTPVIEALNEELGGPNGQTRVTSAGIYRGYAIFEAQDPQRPRNLDRYYYDGEFDAPDPIHTSASDTVETELFSVGDVNWAAIPDLVQIALDELALEGGTADYATVFRIGEEITIQIPVQGTRMSGYLRATAAGEVIEVRVN